MKALPFIASLFVFAFSWGQAELRPLLEEMPNDTLIKRGLNQHLSIQPRLIDLSPKVNTNDSTKNKTSTLNFSPIVDGGYRTFNNDYRGLLGIGFVGKFNSKWYSQMSYQHGFESASDNYVLQTVYTQPKGFNLNEKIDFRGRLSYTPHHFVNLQIGYDENFIGEGQRSLLLSDYGKPYGFGSLRLNFWKIEYLVLYQFMRERILNDRVNKYGTTHYLNFSATKWLQFGLFETVFFAPKDTLLNRGYEPEYLNPMIFFRPQEYSLGSADNVLIGLDLAADYQKWTFYSQLIIDEFSLTEIRAKTKWWANKYGIQLGVKGRTNIFGKPLFLRVEMNTVRPYTYSHLSLEQSYTHANSVLAHPYEANFGEILVEAKYRWKKWLGEVFWNYGLKGYNDIYNQGSNIFIPYIDRPGDYGHTLGQGIHNNFMTVLTRASYKLFGRANAFVEYQFRFNTHMKLPANQLVIGIRTNIWNDYRNY